MNYIEINNLNKMESKEKSTYETLLEMQYEIISDSILSRSDIQEGVIKEMQELTEEVARARVDAVNVSESIFYQTIKPLIVKDRNEETKSNNTKTKSKKNLNDLKERSSSHEKPLIDELIKRKIIPEKEFSKLYPYAAVSQIQNMLRIFRDHQESFKFLIETAIKTWDDLELEFFAECLVQFFLCSPDSDSPYDSLMERLPDIIDIDIRLCKDRLNLNQIQLDSFSVKIFNNIVKLPEARHYLQKTLNKFYDEIDYKYIMYYFYFKT